MPDFACPEPIPAGANYIFLDGLEGEVVDGLTANIESDGLKVRFAAVPYDFRWFGETTVSV